MNLYKSITEEVKNNFFMSKGLKIAQDINSAKGTLNNDREVSEAVANAANEAGVNCEVLDVKVFAAHMTKDSYNSSDDLVCMLDSEKLFNKSHTVIYVPDKNYIVDYTAMQYKGSNNPEDTLINIAMPIEKVVDEVWQPMHLGTKQFFDDTGLLYVIK